MRILLAFALSFAASGVMAQTYQTFGDRSGNSMTFGMVNGQPFSYQTFGNQFGGGSMTFGQVNGHPFSAQTFGDGMGGGTTYFNGD